MRYYIMRARPLGPGGQQEAAMAVVANRAMMGAPVGTSLKRACFACRVCFHASRRSPRERPCPNCHGETVEMGTHFRAPRKRDKRAWAGLEAMAKAGVFFGKYGAGPTPKTPGQARAWQASRGLGKIIEANDAAAKDALGMRPDKSGRVDHWEWRLREWRG